MTSSERRYDAVLAGYFGFGNFGDEMIADSAVRSLVAAGLSADRICVLSNAPRAAERALGVKAVDRWALKDVFRILGRSRSLIFPGGGLFQDATSVRSCIYYWGLCAMASMQRCRISALGQSIGPLTTRVGKFLYKRAFLKMSFVRARDAVSNEALLHIGARSELMPDTVFGLSIPQTVRDEHGPVLVNMRPALTDEAPLQDISKAVDLLVRTGREVRYAAMSKDDEREMSLRIASGELPASQVHLITSIDDFASLARGCSAALGMRLHFAIFCAMLGLPICVASYDIKVSSFASEGGAPDLSRGDMSIEDCMKLTLTNGPFCAKKKEEYSKRVRAAFSDCVEQVLNDRRGRAKDSA